MYGFSITLLIIGVLILVIKVLQRLIWVWDNSPTCLIGKTAIVTGANTGIGFFVAQDLAKRGAKVILGCRNEAKAKIAQSKIIKTTGNPNILTLPLDLSSFASVRKFVQHIQATEEDLHILINNAGGLYLDTTRTADGINPVKQVNYLGPFLLTILLLDMLKKSAPSRVVNYGSLTCHMVTVDSDSLNSFNSKMYDYGQSKLLNIMFTNELAKRLGVSGVIANSANPGDSSTDITRNFPAVMGISVILFKLLFCKTPEQGAQTPIYAAVSKDVENSSGRYFDNCREAWLPPMPKIAYNTNVCKKIFEESLKIVKLNSDELKQLNCLFNSCKK